MWVGGGWRKNGMLTEYKRQMLHRNVQKKRRESESVSGTKIGRPSRKPSHPEMSAQPIMFALE